MIFTANINTNGEEDIDGASCGESLDEGLLRIFNSQNNTLIYRPVGADRILQEAYRISERVEEELLDDCAFHELFEEMKYSLGAYSSASVGMMMMFGILAAKENVRFRNMKLLEKIESKYKLRPWMKDVKTLAHQVRNERKHNNKNTKMSDKDNLDGLRGLFEGGNFPNAQINVVPGDGVHISYESQKKVKEEKCEGIKQSVMDYVGRLMPVVTAGFREQYAKIWQDILEQDAVSRVVYEKGSQKGTLFNRNLVAQISHMMAVNGVIVKETTDVRMAELLEPEKGKNHSVRGALAVTPDDKLVKKAVNDVLERYGVKVL